MPSMINATGWDMSRVLAAPASAAATSRRSASVSQTAPPGVLASIGLPSRALACMMTTGSLSA